MNFTDDKVIENYNKIHRNLQNKLRKVQLRKQIINIIRYENKQQNQQNRTYMAQ